MTTLKVEIVEELKRFIDSQVDCGMYATPSELVQDLLMWHKRQMEDLSLRDQFLKRLINKRGTVRQSDLNRAWQRVHEHRLQELRADVRKGLDQLDRGEYVTYDSVDDAVANIKALAKRRIGKSRSGGRSAPARRP